jgi:hypothetical protein
MASRRSNIEVAGIATIVLSAPSSCCPLGERSRQHEQITGSTMKAGVQG